jgi:hypothetical protein
MIEAFHFRDDQLFGCYHPPADLGSQRLLVICPPFFDEYRRSYKALADLANACAEQGVHVLRFNFYGTGESQGILEQASVDKWKKDVSDTIEEGINLSGASQVALLGVRFSATLLSEIKNVHVTRFIFWDPVISGARYIAWLDEVNQILKKQQQKIARDINRPFEQIEYVNFRLSSELRAGMEAVSFNLSAMGGSAKAYVITTDKNVFDSKVYDNCEFPGLSYDWAPYHDGIISQKPVLEAIARRVLEP